MFTMKGMKGALERQDLSRTYLPHHELESIVIIIIIINKGSIFSLLDCHAV